MGAKEIAVQAAAAEAGAPTPTVHLTGPAGGPLGDAGGHGPRTRRSAPRRPDGATAPPPPRIRPACLPKLADTMAAVHHIDPAPVMRASTPSHPPSR